MRRGHLLFSALHFLMTVALLSVAGLFLSLAYLPGARVRFVEYFSRPHAAFATTGFFLLGTGFLLLIFLRYLHRPAFIRLSMRDASYEESLVRKEVDLFWAEQFPEEKRPEDLHFSSGKIEVIAPMPEKVETLEEIEEKLGKLLKKKFGYDGSFFLTVTKK